MHPAGLHAMFAVLVGRRIGRSSPRTERRWVTIIASVLLRSARIRNISRNNLRRCFPEKPQEDIDRLADQATREVARAVVETFKVWFPGRTGRDPFASVEYHGREHFEAALADGRGILLLNCHFGSLDLNGALFRRLDRQGRRMIGVYRQPSNPHVDKVIRHGRANIVDRAIPISEPRAIVAELKSGSIVWLAPDIEASGRRAVMAPLFGARASTSTWPSRLADLGNAVVLPTRHVRTSDGPDYTYEFLPPFADFPSVDDAADARRFNEFVEETIMRKPEMYWWCIKRFKHSPDQPRGGV